MDTAARAELDAGHAVGGEMDGIGARPAYGRRRPLTHDGALSLAERLNDGQALIHCHRRIGDVEEQLWLGDFLALREGPRVRRLVP